MSSSNLLVIVLSLSISAVTIAITTTVDVNTTTSLVSPINYSSPVEGDYTLANCDSNCKLHYKGSINLSITQNAANDPLKVDNDFQLESIEIVSEVASEAGSEAVS